MLNARIADNGHLMFVLEDGSIVDAGNVRGMPGPPGDKGIGIKGDKGDPGPAGIGYIAYNGVCVDDGVSVQLDNIIVQMNTANPRSLQFKVATGTLSVNITGQIYWANGSYGGNYGASYFKFV